MTYRDLKKGQTFEAFLDGQKIEAGEVISLDVDKKIMKIKRIHEGTILLYDGPILDRLVFESN